MNALLIVDMQRDFCPGGALAVAEGDAIIPTINALMEHFPILLASKDWHPPESTHFQKWPVHCVRGTPGADFHPKLRASRIQKTFHKGTGPREDGYSLFQSHETPGPEEWLRQKGVKRLFVTGLAADHCVKASAVEAAQKGFETYVIADATRAVGDLQKTLDEIARLGVRLISSQEILSGRHPAFAHNTANG